jgi:HSP20 family molecular chaperone IbpA
MKTIRLQNQTAEAILREVEQVRDRIRQRAHEFFSHRGGRLGSALDDWLMAERESVWRPAIEVCQKDRHLVIEVAAAGLEAGDLDVQVTPETVLVCAAAGHVHSEAKGIVHVCEFEPGRLFRLITLPVPINPAEVTSTFRNGLLTIKAAVAVTQPVRTVDVRAA